MRLLKYAIFKLFFVSLSPILISGCSPQPMLFSDAPPVMMLRDDRPIPRPVSTEYEEVYYYFNNIARRPIIRSLEFKRTPRAQDVNSMDDAPQSTWYTPRLGYRPISPEELLHGVETIGPPCKPFRVIKAKHGGNNPGFIIEDNRGIRYLAKFDPPEFPAIETTTALIVNRLFWGFGYNVPEDYLIFFKPEDLVLPGESELTRTDLERVLSSVAEPVNGQYRSTFSMFIQGKIVGPIKEKGVREDDFNDRIPHQNRRILRAMRVFGAFTNHSDIRSDNTLDTYIGEDSMGHVVHYMLDFGEAFGGHGAEHDWLWDGYTHYFNYSQMFENLFTFGFKVQPWENIEYTEWKSVGAFEASVFDPEEWRETYQFLPVRMSLPDDDYWAAKIVGASTNEHIETLVEAACYPEAEAAEYIIKTLIERRRKVLTYFLEQVSPLEYVTSCLNGFALSDVTREIFPHEFENSQYIVRCFDANGQEIVAPQTITDVDRQFDVILEPVIFKSQDYLRIDVQAVRPPDAPHPPAQFHFNISGDANLSLVGVVH